MKKNSRAKSASPLKSPKWLLVDDLYAILDASPDVVFENELIRIEPNIAICKKLEEEVNIKSNETKTSVYRLGKEGPYGIPSGLIYIRFNGEHGLAHYQDQIDEAGFKIEKESVSRSGWIRPKLSLNQEPMKNMDKLEKLPNVANIEPQFLMARQLK